MLFSLSACGCRQQVKQNRAHQRGGGEDHAAARQKSKGEPEKGIMLHGKLLVQREQHIKFSPCSPGEIIEMAQYLGVDPNREFYLLPVVRRAVVAPFPQDWAVGADRLGNSYYYNKYTMKVIASHPLSELFIDWVVASRQRLADETELRHKDTHEDEKVEEDMGTPWMRFSTEQDGIYYWFNFQNRKLYTDPQYKHILELELEERAKDFQQTNVVSAKQQAELEHQVQPHRRPSPPNPFFLSLPSPTSLRLALTCRQTKAGKAKESN